MIASSKEKIYRDGVRCQSVKSDRDPHRVCPSKLSKKELEDLYFSLMDTNLELKRTVNMQQDNIKMLNTRVHRLMTAQKSSVKENTCCAPTKSVVLEQKDTIADLKKANDRMSERIRILNMRLCSAKQFLKRCPSHANAKCIKCLTAPPASLKNSSVSVIQSKRSESEHKPSGSPVQGADKEPITTRTVETETDEGERENESRTLCKENKCRTLIEELKQKIIDLQEESSKHHSEYADRIARLEQEMCGLQADNERVRRERGAARQELQQRAARQLQLAATLRHADAHCNDIASQLLIEKSKVAELETRVKAADMGSLAAKALENGQNLDMEGDVPVAKKESPDAPPKLSRHSGYAASYTNLVLTHSPDKAASSPDKSTTSPDKSTTSPDKSTTSPDKSTISPEKSTTSPDKSKHSDDSGYNDNPRTGDDEALSKINKELEKKITDLQGQLDILRIASAGMRNEQPAKVSEATNVETMVDETTQQDKRCSKDARTGGTKNLASERKGEPSPERPTIDILRANEIWGKIADDGVQQKEEKIQFINTGKERSSRDSCGSSPNRLTSLDRGAVKDKAKKRAETKKSFEPNVTDVDAEKSKDNSKNELVDKIVDTANIDKSAQTKIDSDARRDSKLEDAFQRDVPTQDYFRHERISPDIIRRDIGTFDDFKRDSEIQDNIEDLNQNERLQDIKRDAKTQGEGKRSSKVKDYVVKILDNDILRPGENDKRESSAQSKEIYKYIDRKSRRDSKAETEEQNTANDSLQDMKNQYDTKMSTGIQNTSTDEDSVASDSIHSPVELCEQSVRLCSCLRAPRRAVSVFRSCSGTLRFRTTDAGGAFRKCRTCTATQNPKTSDTSNDIKATVPKSGQRRVSIAKCCAPPDDTDLEISHLSDLPNERDGKSPRDAMSPGEQRTTPTYTDSYTEPSTELPTLSEGEMLVASGRRRSLGETKDEAVEVKTDMLSVSRKMEQALQSIGEELARCRLLLQSQRELDQSKQTKEASMNCPSHLALRNCPATPQLAPAAANKCTFTLHIGTLVLSDEAVVHSRDKSLLLSWKFYEQNVAMTRMRSGRVVLFDFTTEYDAEMDERFMDYLKYEAIVIVICELNKQNSPFASCKLPLRDVLLNANHRVDMSLAMTVGPDMLRSMATHSVDSLVKSDEVGVLDLWCMLRKQPSQADQRPMTYQDRLHYCSDDYRMSSSNGEHLKRTSPISPEPRANALQGETSSIRDDPLRQPSQLLDDSSLAKYSIRPNSIITNEVPTNIRCSGEMKRALDRNAEQNNMPPITGLAKLEEDVMSTQNNQNIRSASWTKFIRRQSRSQKKRGKSGGQTSDVIETIKKSWKPHNREFKFNTPTQSYSYIEEPPELGEASRDTGSKKSVTIVPRYSNLGWEQKKQDVERTHKLPKESIDISILWLALNEECSAMTDPTVQRLYVAYSLLGRSGADLETPVSLPKPRSYIDKCVFNFKKTIQVKQCDMALLGHMGRCRSIDVTVHDPKDCIVFTVISEPAEDPLGLASCEDIGYASLYLGDVLSYCAGSDTYTEVIAVRSALRADVVVGVLCVQLDGLEVVRRAKLLDRSASFKF